VQRKLPETKGILLIRDPVARAWSSISMLAGRTASIWPCSRIRSNFVSISNAKGTNAFLPDGNHAPLVEARAENPDPGFPVSAGKILR
jgi:hypothetical protein